MTCRVKICGLMTADAVDAAVQAGADMVGFVFFPPSPRSVDVGTAAALTARTPDRVTRVALSVDADDALLDLIAADAGIDMMQFHGHETVERVRTVRVRYGLPVMKAVAIAGPEDVIRAHAYEAVADQLMFDAKPPPDAARPGGNALAFDWRLIAGEQWKTPWVLAGGLTPENVTGAIRASSAGAVDVSSGVEDAPGAKNPAKIKAFIDAAKGRGAD